MELLTGYVYSIRNKLNGKEYIGQTIKPLKKRLVTHFSKHSHCARLKSAIQKYGESNFEVTVLMTAFAPNKAILDSELNLAEKRLIDQRKSLHPFGYNLTSGGDKTRMSAEAIRKMAKGHMKPVLCLETGEVWGSVSECAGSFGVQSKQISKVLKKQRKRLKWKYTLVYLRQS